jgi:hypothetical protein
MKELEKKVIVHRQGSELTVTQPSVNTQTENQSTSVRWYTRFIEKENNLSELEQLCTPEEYGKFRYLGGVK